MSKSLDYLVFIGRFQPFHNGHLRVARAALARSEHLIMLCGSARQPRNTRNPWSVSEVETMIRDSLSEAVSPRVTVLPLMDVRYNDELWVRSVQEAVAQIVTAQAKPDAARPRIGLIGLSEDGESYYPKRFPQWTPITVEQDNGLRGTAVRDALFGMGDDLAESGVAYLESPSAKAALPEPVRKQLIDYCSSPAYAQISDEASFLAKYRSAWADSPYPPTFVTVDAVVIQSGHLLLVERKAQPGRGLWALPGGFINDDETLEHACLRELREETRLKVPAPVLKGSIRNQRVFDAPDRSQRGRTITHAFHIELEPNIVLPKVRGGDDARHAFWVPLAELNPEKLFEDHYFIIQAMLG